METCCIIVEKRNAKYVKKLLESVVLLHNDFKITKIDNTVAIPITFKHVADNFCVDTLPPISCLFMIKYISNSKLQPSTTKTHFEKLHEFVQGHLKGVEMPCEKRELLLIDLPTKWDIHGDLVMFPDTSFTCDYWKNITPDFWKKVANIYDVKRVALKSRICGDNYRSPKVLLKLGENGIVQHIDNGIRYTYDVTKNMFSKGNISEKLRIAKFDCEDEVVVDMFAGIGYFTLPYLVKAKAKTVYACDWNPDAVSFLRHNLHVNKVENRCVVLHGDNKKVTPKNVADRVNLGLIPTSSAAWQSACEALKSDTGGWLHIHENIETSKMNNVASEDKKKRCECKRYGRLCVVNEASDKTLSEAQRLATCAFVYDCAEKLKSYLGALGGGCEENDEDDESDENSDEGLGSWNVLLDHVEYVKSYAPHVHHMVFDLECRPESYYKRRAGQE